MAVVGAGIAGLAAAYFLREAGAEVTVLEGSPRLGGKLALGEVAGLPVDVGAEALLARRPEGTDLIGQAGLAGQLVQPGTTAAGLWTRGRLRPLPRRQLMGVPADLDELAGTGILSADGLARARGDLELAATDTGGDVPVASLVAARFGREVVDRLVDPLLGGVYAGRSDELSFEATLPALARVSREHRSLTEAAAAVLGQGRDRSGGGSARPQPVFTTLAGGLGTLPPALAAASGARVRTGAMVRGLARTPGPLAPPGSSRPPGPPGPPALAGGWRLTVGSAATPELLDADAVILAVPGRPASRLLAGVPGTAAAATALAEIGYASMAIVTLAYPVTAFGGTGPPQGSGFLVPAVDGRAVKAVTFSTVKWPHLLDRQPGAGRTGRAPLHLVRCSLGRHGDEEILQRDDAELIALAAADLADATGVSGPPADARVSRWGGGLPQYTVGHLSRVRRIRDGVASQPGLAVCGAAYDGIGIPACIGTARLAADQVLAYLESRESRENPAGGPRALATGGESAHGWH